MMDQKHGSPERKVSKILDLQKLQSGEKKSPVSKMSLKFDLASLIGNVS